MQLGSGDKQKSVAASGLGSKVGSVKAEVSNGKNKADGPNLTKTPKWVWREKSHASPLSGVSVSISPSNSLVSILALKSMKLALTTSGEFVP